MSTFDNECAEFGCLDEHDEWSLWLYSEGTGIHHACGPFDRILALGERYKAARVADYGMSICCRSASQPVPCGFLRGQHPTADNVLAEALARAEGRR